MQQQVELPIVYYRKVLDVAYRLDLLAEGSTVVEIKAVSAILPIDEAQLLTYLRLSGHQVGLLLNFHVAKMRDGIKRPIDSR